MQRNAPAAASQGAVAARPVFTPKGLNHPGRPLAICARRPATYFRRMVAAPPRSALPSPTTPSRILTAVPRCDGHDSAILTINLELARRGFEVIYLGYDQSASAIARAAVQEDVHAVGLSSYNGGHVVFFREVVAQLRARGAADIPVLGGGGGTITAADARAMRRGGVRRIFFAGTPLDEVVSLVQRETASVRRSTRVLRGDRSLARAISLAESSDRAPRPAPKSKSRPAAKKPFVVGVTGPGGAGKSTLIDELTSRFLREHPAGRLAILANDPSHPGAGGALLGDRVSAIYAQTDRVFFRSLATRGSPTGLSAAIPRALDVLRASGEFDLIFVESVGIAQDGDPFACWRSPNRLVDAVALVVSPHYGGRVQLQKIPLLDGADWVVLNKGDDPRATAAKAELAERLGPSAPAGRLHTTTAANHQDFGTHRLYGAIADLAGLVSTGGEKPCLLPEFA